MVRLALAALASAFAFALPEPAHAQRQYTFEKVLDSDDGYDPFEFGTAQINDRGDVVLRTARLDPNDPFTSSEVILRADVAGGLVTIVDEDTHGTRFLSRNPSINELGDVSFAATLPGSRNEVIARGQGTQLVLIASTQPLGGRPGRFDSFGFDTSINNRREVSFRGELDDFDIGLFSGSGRSVTTHYLDSTSRFGGSFAVTAINDAGEIAFEESVGGESGVFRGSKGRFVTIAMSPGHSYSDPSLNSAGVAAFYDEFFDGPQQVFAVAKGSGGPVKHVADTRGAFAAFGFRPPAINALGEVAFLAELRSRVFPPPSAIFLGPDPVQDRVVGTGDVLDGERVTSLTFSEGGLNKAGELAFTAFFEDAVTFETRTAVFRAIPVP